MQSKSHFSFELVGKESIKRHYLTVAPLNVLSIPECYAPGPFFSFLLPFIPVLLLHLSHACITPRPPWTCQLIPDSSCTFILLALTHFLAMTRT